MYIHTFIYLYEKRKEKKTPLFGGSDESGLKNIFPWEALISILQLL